MVDSITSAANAAATQSEQSSAKLADDMDQFMNLLVTQLQNQDPLEPMDPNQFTEQLVQFATVEQQIQGNQHLESLLALQEETQISTSAGYVDKVIEANGDKLVLESGKSKATYTLNEDATKVTLNILNADGDSVFVASGDNESGPHLVGWDGLNKQGFAEPDGVYTLVVSALDADGSPLDVSQTMTGRVTGMTVGDEGPILNLSGHAVPLDDLIGVESYSTYYQ